MTTYTHIDTAFGRLLLVADDDVLTGLHFAGDRYAPAPAAGWRHAPGAPVFAAVAAQLAEYAAGRRRAFDLPLAPRGTPFQRRVWAQIGAIGFGETVSYGVLAARAGSPRAVRAAGAATGRNPISIVVPCHRVVGSDGSLTGYGGGLDRKRALLALEGVLGLDDRVSSGARR